jgi:hypothetical protein
MPEITSPENQEKTSRQTVKKYYTYIGEDAKTLIKEWLKIGMAKDETRN